MWGYRLKSADGQLVYLLNCCVSNSSHTVFKSSKLKLASHNPDDMDIQMVMPIFIHIFCDRARIRGVLITINDSSNVLRCIIQKR